MLASKAVHPITRKAISAAVRLGMESLRAKPPLRLSEWARQHFVLAGESSHQKGGWEAWPFQVGILDAMSNDDIEELDVQKSKRVGYTKGVAAFVAYNIAHRGRKQALWQPTDDDRDSFVKSEIEPLLDEVAAVRAARRKGTATEDTMKMKVFRDSVAHFLGGKAARAYRRITVAVAILDEWSGFDQVIEKSSDPGTLARGRLEGAPYPKFVGGSTPRVRGLCHVERARLLADADLRYHIRCPHCRELHPLTWGGKEAKHGMRWDKGAPDTVRHVCPHCGSEIRQGDYLQAWDDGARWVCIKTGIWYDHHAGTWHNASGAPQRPPRHVAMHVWAGYSPQRTWVDIVREFEAATQSAERGDTGPLNGFVNETLGETWEVKGERAEEHELQSRADDIPLGVVPIGALVITAGIDLQGNRWEIGVWAWGRGMESWPIEHHVIEGNPADERDWQMVDEYLSRRYRQAWHGGTMAISAISIDSGHHTQAVYNWVRLQAGRRTVYCIKGSSEEKRPIKGTGSSQDVTWRGQRWPAGVKLWSMGVDTVKDLLHGQLQIATPGPGYVHFSKQLPREWYEQLTAEQRIPVNTSTGVSYRWVKRRPRNEVLDCRVYSTHSAYMLGLDRMSPASWDRLEQAVQPPRDMFAFAQDESAPAEARPAAAQVEEAPRPQPEAAHHLAVQRAATAARRAQPRRLA